MIFDRSGIFVSVLVCSQLCVVCSAEAEPTGEAGHLDTQSIELKYDVFRALAKTGGADEKLQVFLFVRESLPTLVSKLPEAVYFLRQSAQSGLTEAQYVLGYHLVRESPDPDDISEGKVWLNNAARSGHKQAEFWLGLTYLNEYYRSVNDRNRQASYRLAVEWLSRAADIGGSATEISLDARVRLGQLYLARSIQDPQGWDLLMEAADKDYGPALSTLQRLNEFLAKQVELGYTEAEPVRDRVETYLERRKD